MICYLPTGERITWDPEMSASLAGHRLSLEELRINYRSPRAFWTFGGTPCPGADAYASLVFNLRSFIGGAFDESE